jgi:hypothetical protein
MELYRHFDEQNQLLYVGVSISTMTRLRQHRDCSSWFDKIKRVDVQRFESREDALIAEREAIKAEKPLFNVYHRKEVRAFTEEVSALSPRQQSLLRLEIGLVTFKPIYKFYEARDVLQIPTGALRRLIESDQIGYVIVDGYSPRSLNAYHITGWQLIEYIEHWEQQTKENPSRLPSEASAIR